MADIKKYTGPRTQDFIPVKEIRDGIVVLEDGSLRAVLLASAINVALKSADEQQAMIMQFQGFLNSVEFPIQISVQSRPSREELNNKRKNCCDYRRANILNLLNGLLIR